jgi:uncharacterized membrane protein
MPSFKDRSRTLSVVVAVLTLSYPFLALIGMRYFPPEAVVAVLCLLVASRLVLGRRGAVDLVLAAVLACEVLLLRLESTVAVRLYPLLVNLGLATVFAYTLWSPPPMIERFARVTHPDLPDAAIPYLRNVTAAWVCFLVLNGAAAAWTVAFGTLEQWAFYNGFIAYLLIGAMLAGELVVRRWVLGRAGRGV